METHTIPEVQTETDLLAATEPLEATYVLFYAEWCPFSRMFLPVFNQFGQTHTGSYLRVLLEDNDELWEKYCIKVVPTVLFFQHDVVAARLDGTSGRGLTGQELQKFIATTSK